MNILNLGAGVQSTTLYIMSMRQDEPEHVPLFDYAIFADTQEEPRAVYEHLAWLQSLGGPPIIVRTAGKLGDDLVNGMNTTGNRYASIPAYTLSAADGSIGKTRRQCTKEYKTSVVERAIRRDLLFLQPGQRIPNGTTIYQYMGLSFDEPRRVIRVKERHLAIAWSEPQFPLWDMQWTRRDCIEYLREAAPDHEVPRSACTFCPFHSNTEWRRIRDHDPDSWERACEVDKAIRDQDSKAGRGLYGKLYLHRSCKPLREAPIDTPESLGQQYMFSFAQECEGMCGV